MYCNNVSGDGEVTSLPVARGKVYSAKGVLSPGCVVGDGSEGGMPRHTRHIKLPILQQRLIWATAMTLAAAQKDVRDARRADVLACSLYSKAVHLPSRTRRPWQPRVSLVSYPRYTATRTSRPPVGDDACKADQKHTLTCIAELPPTYSHQRIGQHGRPFRPTTCLNSRPSAAPPEQIVQVPHVSGFKQVPPSFARHDTRALLQCHPARSSLAENPRLASRPPTPLRGPSPGREAIQCPAAALFTFQAHRESDWNIPTRLAFTCEDGHHQDEAE